MVIANYTADEQYGVNLGMTFAAAWDIPALRLVGKVRFSHPDICHMAD
jgi:hypothetical protein|tara:strand:+ start:526 stop:669 length:144 start_codon:yes stop_codon:yes gene_type:complete